MIDNATPPLDHFRRPVAALHRFAQDGDAPETLTNKRESEFGAAARALRQPISDGVGDIGVTAKLHTDFERATVALAMCNDDIGQASLASRRTAFAGTARYLINVALNSHKSPEDGGHITFSRVTDNAK